MQLIRGSSCSVSKEYHRGRVLMRTLLVLLLTIGYGQYVQGQGILEKPMDNSSGKQGGIKGTPARISVNLQDRTRGDVVREIAKKANLRLYYTSGDARFRDKISISLDNVLPLQALETALKGTKIEVRPMSDGSGVVLTMGEIADSIEEKSNANSSGTLSGSVVDSASRQPIEGATVTVIGTSLTAVTDKKGAFVFSKVPAGNHVLSVKILGYVSVSQAVTIQSGKAAALQVNLKPSPTSLTEVVTTATGQQRRVEVAHDIATINAAQIMARSPVRSVTDILEAAQVPGVQVQRGGGDPGAATKIRIRGISSISQTNDPVVIVDGIWIDAATSSPSKLDDIDPATIEKIEIVRGPSAATLYGQDASNGVIVITTKKGVAGTTRWNLLYNRDWGQTYGRLPLTYTGMGYHPTTRESVFCPLERMVKYDCIQDTVLIYDPNDPLVGREGVELNNKYTLQVDGGSNAVAYSITGTVLNTTGVRQVSGADKIRFRKVGYPLTSEFRKPSKLDRKNFTTRLDLNPRQNLTFGLTLTRAQTQLRDNSFNSSWKYNHLGAAGEVEVDYFNPDTNIRTDVMHLLSSSEKPVSKNTGVVGATAQYRTGRGLVVNASLGAENSSDESSLYRSSRVCFVGTGCIDTTSTLLSERREESVSGSTYTARVNSSTDLILGKFRKFLEIRPSIGGDLKRVARNNVSVQKNNIPVGDRSISSGNFVSSSHTLYENATAGWYVNSTIGIARRLYFDIGVRQDIGSAITSSSSNKQYPKLGGSWLISDESFWKTNNYINLLRLRSAMGHSAVQPDVQDLYGSFVSNTEYIDGKFVRSVRMGGAGNNALASERGTEIEMGFDADVLYDRVNVALTYARSTNKNALVDRILPPSFGSGGGGDTRKENIGRVSNKNFELSVNSRAIENRIALVVLNYGLTLTENRVERLGSGTTKGGVVTQGAVVEGYPIGGLWTRTVLGYDDLNGDGLLSLDEVTLSDDQVYLGWSQPRYRSSYGINITLLNQITIDSRFAYQSQYVRGIANSSVFRYGSQDAEAPLDQQAREIISTLNQSKPVSDLRWNSASIQYQLPRSLASRINARSVSVSLQGRNLGLWTNYSGKDPSINNDILTGEGASDLGKTAPPARLFVLDFKLGF